MAESKCWWIIKIFMEFICPMIVLLVALFTDSPAWILALMSYVLGRMNLRLQAWLSVALRWLCRIICTVVCWLFGCPWWTPNTCLENPSVERGTGRGEALEGNGHSPGHSHNGPSRGRKRNRGRRR